MQKILVIDDDDNLRGMVVAAEWRVFKGGSSTNGGDAETVSAFSQFWSVVTEMPAWPANSR